MFNSFSEQKAAVQLSDKWLISTPHCLSFCMSVLVKSQYDIQTTACLGNASGLKGVCKILSPVVTLPRKRHRQTGLNGRTTKEVVKEAERIKTHWEYTAPADQWPHLESVCLLEAARPKSSEAFSALQITNQHQTPNKGTSTSFKSN